jgi:K+ transporter
MEIDVIFLHSNFAKICIGKVFFVMEQAIIFVMKTYPPQRIDP